MLWDDFLNSLHRDWKGGGTADDRLDKPDWLTRWIADHDLPYQAPPSQDELEALKRLREWILGIVRDLIAGAPVDPKALDDLNLTLAGGPVIRQLVRNDSGLQLNTVPLKTGWPGILADIAASFCRTLTTGETSRLRICDNPDCLWVYYDETRNRSKKYCDDKMCGNLMKVRRFRAKQKAANSGSLRN